MPENYCIVLYNYYYCFYYYQHYLLQSMKITSYHGLVESTSIHCHDSGIHALFTDLVGGLKGTRT